MYGFLSLTGLMIVFATGVLGVLFAEASGFAMFILGARSLRLLGLSLSIISILLLMISPVTHLLSTQIK
jgi:hypothetical protein